MENTLYITNTFQIENAVEEKDQISIIGYCCHYGVTNLNQERVDENSFNYFFDLYNSKKITPVINYNHDNNQIIGKVDDLVSDNKGLIMEAHINKGVKIVDDMLLQNILNGDIKSLSTEGFIRGGYDGIVEYEDGSYYVKDFILTAVAIVPTPADWQAEFTIANYINTYKQQKLQEVLNNLNETEINKIKWYFL